MVRNIAEGLALITRFTLLLASVFYIPYVLWKLVISPFTEGYIPVLQILFLPFTVVLGPALLGMWWLYGVYILGAIIVAIADALVAATAHAHAATIVTGNMDDYPMKEASKLSLPRWSGCAS